MLKNDSTNRNYWKFAKVEELLCGADGKTRAADVKVACKQYKSPGLFTTCCTTPDSYGSEVLKEIAGREDSLPGTRVNDSQRPRRNAAVVGEINRREMNIN